MQVACARSCMRNILGSVELLIPAYRKRIQSELKRLGPSRYRAPFGRAEVSRVYAASRRGARGSFILGRGGSCMQGTRFVLNAIYGSSPKVGDIIRRWAQQVQSRNHMTGMMKRLMDKGLADRIGGFTFTRARGGGSINGTQPGSYSGGPAYHRPRPCTLRCSDLE